MHAGVMFERFTAYARHVVVLAQEQARGLNHNYIGTEHILLGLLAEPDGVAFGILQGVGMSLDGARQEVVDMIGLGKQQPSGKVPFTPRAKKTLELSLREAVQLRHHYIGTEHILLGLIREGDGVAAQIMRKHADLSAIRTAVLDAVPAGEEQESERGTARRWRRARLVSRPSESVAPPSEQSLNATPAADTTLTEAARLAGAQPVGSHHLLLAALADEDSAAARALATLGVNLKQAKEALRGADVTGTSDEQPEVAGRRHMVIHVAEDRLTIEASDPVIVAAGQAALRALGEDAAASGAISGDVPVAASLSIVWQALRESLATIEEQANPEAAQHSERGQVKRARRLRPGEMPGDAADAG
jgi:ATP-dependent Clp protease ATP-binding subunit ClpA